MPCLRTPATAVLERIHSAGPRLKGDGYLLHFSLQAFQLATYFSAGHTVVIYNDQKLPASTAEWDFITTEAFTLRSQMGTGADQFTFESHTLRSVNYAIIPEPQFPILVASCGILSGLMRRRIR